MTNWAKKQDFYYIAKDLGLPGSVMSCDGPRDEWLKRIATKSEKAAKYLATHPIPPYKQAFDNEAHADNGIWYVLLRASNVYSSNDSWDKYGWWSNYQDEPITRTELNKKLKNICINFAYKHFRDIEVGGARAQVFNSRDAFKKACDKVGLNPHFEDED